MAKIRALEWETEEYWLQRISAYINGKHDPQNALPPRTAFVAIVSGEVKGFVAGHLTTRFNCDGELQWINVTPDLRQNGIASNLLPLLFDWFKKQRAFKICVDPGNEMARKFYRKHGAEDLNAHWMVWQNIKVFKK